MERIDQLISDYFDGELKPLDAQELAQRLEQDPKLRRLFLELYREHQLLAVEHTPFSETEFVAAVLEELRSDEKDFVGSVMRGLPKSAVDGSSQRARPRGRQGARVRAWNRSRDFVRLGSLHQPGLLWRPAWQS